ncbi:DDE-type integrase/transposase/recombinase [Streptomyces sp. 130]|nr:DDE-type integrase/transposase/recombinase [Streptomyces sp. 130]
MTPSPASPTTSSPRAATSPHCRPRRAESTSPAGWTWPPARSSATRWPTTTAPTSSSTHSTWLTGRGGLQSGCIIHSDRGSEYTSSRFCCRIQQLGLRQSCGRTGSCFDNAAAESFWALLKEEIGTRVWPDRTTARADVFDFIETFYNRRRLRRHRVFGNLTPAETRQRHRHALAA